MNDARLLSRFQQIERDAYARGFEAAKAAALAAIDELVESCSSTTGALVGLTWAHNAIKQIEPAKIRKVPE